MSGLQLYRKNYRNGLLCGESCMILTSSAFDWSTRVTDGQTYRLQTYRRTSDSIIAQSACMLSRAETVADCAISIGPTWVGLMIYTKL